MIILEREVSEQGLVTVALYMYRLHHEVEVGMGFTQPRAEGPRIV